MAIIAEVTLTSTFRNQRTDAFGKTYQNCGDKATLRFSEKEFEDFKSECDSENGWAEVNKFFIEV